MNKIAVLGGSLLCALCAEAQQPLAILKEADLSRWSAFAQNGNTQYDRVMDLEQGVVLRAESHGSASGYRISQSVNLEKTPTLIWQWTVENFPFFKRVHEDGIEKPVTEFDEQHKHGNDFAVRVSVGRSALFGENKTLHYVWSSQSAAGAQWKLDEHNYVMAVNGPEASTLRWQTVSRNVAQDWQAAFGEHIKDLDFVTIMTDADDIKGQAVGYYGDIAWQANSALTAN